MDNLSRWRPRTAGVFSKGGLNNGKWRRPTSFIALDMKTLLTQEFLVIHGVHHDAKVLEPLSFLVKSLIAVDGDFLG